MDTGKFTCNICTGKIRVDFDMCGDTIECPHCSNSIMVPLTGIRSGMTVASYCLKRRLGMGAMGEVWLAIEPATGRKTALKILSPALTRSDTFIQRFRREVSLAAKMSHPNIITAFDAGVDRGIYYLAINYIKGSDVETILRKDGNMSEREALSIGLLTAEALAYAFEQHGIIHRDIKPSNIMIDAEGTPLLMDLGVSRRIDETEAEITTAGQFVGTPYYMSPEQARADPAVGVASDIYSLGCSLYHMLTGKVPFEADSNVEILSKHIQETPTPIRSINSGVSDECEELIAKMLAKDQSRRQTSWPEVIVDIGSILGKEMEGSNGFRPSATRISPPAEPTAIGAENPGRGLFYDNISYLVAGAIFAVLLLIAFWIVANI